MSVMNKQVNQSFVEANIQSQFILRLLHDGLLPTNFYRTVSDFGAGDTLDIPTIGEAKIQEVQQDVPIVFNPIETGKVQLQITEFVGDAYSVADTLREDGTNIPALLSARAQESTRALQEHFESQALSVLNAAQTDADPNTINGRAHRIASAETNNVASVEHFNLMKLAFDKAQAPYGGRLAIVDPVVASTLWNKYQGTYSVDSNPVLQGILEGGFARDHEFVMNIAGWMVMTSNRLPKGSFGDGTTTVADGVANIFMSIYDDQTKPLMAAWRRMPRTETDRDIRKQEDQFLTTARFGFGAQRVDTLGVLITSASNIE